MKPSVIHIFFTSADEDAEALARRVADSVTVFAEVKLHDVSKLRDNQPWLEHRPGSREASVFAISGAILSDERCRERIVRSSAPSNPAGSALFYISSRAPANGWLAEHPDLLPLFERVDIGEPDQHEYLVEALRGFSDDTRREMRRRISAGLALLLGTPLVTAAFVLHIFGLAGMIAPVGVWALLLLPGIVPSTAGKVFMLWSGYAFGWWLSRSGPHDVWPWFGRRWEISPSSVPETDSVSSKDPKAKHWAFESCLATPPEGTPVSVLTRSDCEYALDNWYRNLVTNWRIIIFMFWYALIPAQCLLLYGQRLSGWALPLAVLLGAVMPQFAACLHNWLGILRIKVNGFDESVMARQEAGFDPLPDTRPDRCDYESHRTDDSAHMRIWDRLCIRTQTSCRWSPNSSVVRRRWTRPPDSVFISYAWNDRDIETAAALEESLIRFGTSVFRDKTQIPPFAEWAALAATALARSTHVILILSEATVKGGTCRREIRYVRLRWITDLLPAVICVVTPEDRVAMLHRHDVSPDLQFVLSWCPCISPEEAVDGNAPHTLIAQRRRQGLLRDLRDAALPLRALRRRLRQWQEQSASTVLAVRITPALALTAPVDTLRRFEWLWVKPKAGVTWRLKVYRVANWLSGGAVARRERFAWRRSGMNDVREKFECESAALLVDPLCAGARVGRASWGGNLAVQRGPGDHNKGFNRDGIELHYGIDHAVIDSAIAARLQPTWPTAVCGLGIHMAERAQQSRDAERDEWAEGARKVLNHALELGASGKIGQSCREALEDFNRIDDLPRLNRQD